MTRHQPARSGILVMLLALVAAGCGGEKRADSSDAPLTVTTSTGTFHGSAASGVRQFLGIRYAQAPTGDRRWKAPRPASAPSRTQQAAKPGPKCAQTATAPGAKAATSEDCLFLNVTAPRDRRPGERLPVMVWWHGGGYTSGAGSEYDARRLAAKGRVIVVTANYRLGVFGYFGLRGLPGSGNFGFADQLQALRWADANAKTFGGDPGNVTVFGQSAGGMSTCALLTSPRARGLVDKAAIMSGSCSLKWPSGGLYPGSRAQSPYTSLATSRSDGAAVAARLGCTGKGTLACMRAKPAAELVKHNSEFADHLAHGTKLLPQDPAVAVRRGDFARIPVLSGGTRHEARSFVGGAVQADPGSVTAAAYPELLGKAFGDDAPAVRARYPLRRFGSAALAWSTVVTDSAWACPTLRGNREMAEHTKVHAYEFADPHPADVNGVKGSGVPQGAAHATDMPSLFDLGGKKLLGTKKQRGLADRMVSYLASFARTGSPAAQGAPAWHAMSASSPDVLRLAPDGIRTADAAAGHHCAFWESLR